MNHGSAQGAPFDLVHVDLSNKPAWFTTSVTPRGLVPALQHGGKVHLESLDICKYIDVAIPGPPLSIDDTSIQSEVIKAGADLSDAGLKLLAGTGRSWGIGSGQTESQKAAFRNALSRAIVDPIQRFGGPYLLGSSVSLADLVVWPFVRRFDIAAREFAGFDVSQELDGVVGKWLGVMGSRPACQVTFPNADLFLKAFHRHKSLDFFDYDTYRSCELHPDNAIYLQN